MTFQKDSLKIGEFVATMKKIYFVLAGFFTSLSLLLYIIYIMNPAHLLIIEAVKTGDILWQQPIQEEDWFHHEYIHSVEKSKVIEKFKLGSNGQILAMESWTRSFGAGLPYEQKGTVEHIDGYYVLKDLNDPLEHLNMIPSHLYLHTFHFKEEEVILSELPFKKNLIKIQTKERTVFERIAIFADNS